MAPWPPLDLVNVTNTIHNEFVGYGPLAPLHQQLRPSQQLGSVFGVSFSTLTLVVGSRMVSHANN